MRLYPKTTLRTAHMISGVLADAGIDEVITGVNPETGRHIKDTRLLESWSWRKAIES